ncbi:MAG: ankyrin repeat domain-containing protein [Acidobacteriota bacterium]
MKKLFLVFFSPGAAWIEGKNIFEQPLDDHVNFIHQLYREGKVMMAGPFRDGTGGLTIMTVESETEAKELIERDPDVIREILRPEIRAWFPIDWEAYESARADSFRDAVQGLEAGDFSRLEPLFGDPSSPDCRCRIIEWYERGLFASERRALEEALTCACFLGRTEVVDYLMAQGVDPSAGISTGLDGFHWAANRGQLDTVKLLIRRQARLETRSMYGGTVLGTAVWSAINEPRADHIRIVEALIEAGARLDEAGYPTGNDLVDEVLRRYGAA